MKSLMRKVFAFALAAMMIFGIIPWTASADDNTGTFTVAALNVDGLPTYTLNLLFTSISLNADGPGSDGTKAISQKIAGKSWDLLAVSEDFNYHSELMSALTDFQAGTHRGGISSLTNKTDGLNLIWKKNVTVSGESWTRWNDVYSTGIFGSGNGADSMIYKGFRYYQASVVEGVNVDIYILHMDAASDAGDIAAREKQMQQLVTAIKASDNGNPIIIMGDTNSRYTRERLQEYLINGINADERFEIRDAWVEHVWDGVYPEYGALPLVAEDKISQEDLDKGVQPRPYPDAEVVDKIFYINNSDSEVKLEALSYTIDKDFVNNNGIALADHWPVVVEFKYTITHNYQETARTDPDCEAEGSVTKTCSVCNASYTQVLNALGHQWNDGEDDGVAVTYTCAVCGAANTVAHNYQESARTDSTCVEDGSVTYTCENCEASYEEIIASVGHQWDDGVNSGANVVYTCIACGQTNSTAMDLTVSVEAPKAENGKMVFDARIEDYDYISQNLNVVDHGVLYIPSSRLNGDLTNETKGRTKVIFNSIADDGSFSYLLRADDDFTRYTLRSFIAYENEEGSLTYVYSAPVSGSVSSIG